MPNTKSFPDCVMINASCLDALKRMEDKSVSAFIIDPPYGAQTHGQNVWDIAWTSDFWQQLVKECFRVLVKGGHLIVFASGKTIFDIHAKIALGYKTTLSEDPSFYRMIWKHHSLDSGRVHMHTPRSQFEDILVYFRTGEGKQMFELGTLKKTYALDQHVGRTNVLEFYKDDCRNKPQPTVKKFFKEHPNNSTFDYKPEALMRSLIRDFTSPGHTVVDFCMRHGITAVASKLESRKFIGVELEKEAYKRAISRYSELSSVPVPTNAAGGDEEAVTPPVTKSASMAIIERQKGDEAIRHSLSPLSSTSTPATTDIDYDTGSGVMLTPDSVMPVHHGITCDISRVCPIVGTRYKKKYNNFDVCEVEFLKLPLTEQANYVKISYPNAKKIAMPKLKADAPPMTKKTRRSSDIVLEEVLPKRQAVSLEGKIIDIGTSKCLTKLLVFKRLTSIDGDQYLVAYPDRINELKAMTIWKKDVQRCVGEISARDMKTLGKATMPSRF